MNYIQLWSLLLIVLIIVIITFFALKKKINFMFKSKKKIKNKSDDNDNTRINEWTPIHEAAVSAIVNKKAEVILPDEGINEIDKNGWTILHFAACAGCISVIENLLSAGANTELIVPDAGMNPLCLAITKQKEDAVKCLLAAGANPSSYLKKLENSLLLIALQLSSPNKNIVMELIKNGADIHCTNKKNRTPLHFASAKGFVEIAHELIKRGADINAKDDEENTPLEMAQNYCPKSKRAEMIRTILGHINGDPVDPEDQFQLGISIVEADLKEAERLIELAANNGHCEAKKAYQKLRNIEKLRPKAFEKIEDPNKIALKQELKQKMREAEIYLLKASWKGDLGFVYQLLETGINANAKGEHGLAALHIVSYVSGTRTDIINNLLHHGADINLHEDNYEYTALHIAAGRGLLSKVEHLIKKGADINAVDKVGATPLDIAEENSQNHIVGFLKEKGANRGSKISASEGLSIPDGKIGDALEAIKKK